MLFYLPRKTSHFWFESKFINITTPNTHNELGNFIKNYCQTFEKFVCKYFQISDKLELQKKWNSICLSMLKNSSVSKSVTCKIFHVILFL